MSDREWASILHQLVVVASAGVDSSCRAVARQVTCGQTGRETGLSAGLRDRCGCGKVVEGPLNAAGGRYCTDAVAGGAGTMATDKRCELCVNWTRITWHGLMAPAEPEMRFRSSIRRIRSSS